MGKRILLMLGMAMMLGIVYSGRGLALTADEIVDKAIHVAFYQGDDMKVNVIMKIVDSQGRVRKRNIVMLRKDIEEDKEQKYYVYFLEPPDVEGMVYMVWKHLGRDDDRWLYLPALDLVRRIAATDKRSSFVGSDFVYEDISGRTRDQDTHELVEEKDDVYVIKCVPKRPETVEFAYYIVQIRKDNFVPVKFEYYDGTGKLFRTIEVLEIKDIQGYPTVTKARATNLETGGHTDLDYKSVEYNLGIPENIFTERYLRRPPKKWIKL